jgi:2-dehydro-3-deoxyglucarate aldolase
VKYSNAAAIVAIQIETRAALEAVDEIAAIPGVTIAWFGPHDYALECGLLGPEAEAAVMEAAKRVAEACSRARITSAVQLSNLTEGLPYFELGYRCISVGKDTALFGAIARQSLESVRALNTGRSMDGRG